MGLNSVLAEFALAAPLGSLLAGAWVNMARGPVQRAIGVACALSYLATIGCGPKVAPPPPSMDPAAVAAAAISQLDSNKNGAIEAAEMASAPGLRSAASMIDADKSGSLTESEIAARLKRYTEFPVANLTFTCIFTQGGQPLTEAEVRFVPESYFGDSRRLATGKTDANGLLDLKVEGQDTFGVPNGIYRIEISKKDAAGQETLPAAVNSSSQQGQEIAFDRRELEGGLRIEIAGGAAGQ